MTNLSGKYVIRSMTTTDSVMGGPVIPYHIYLQKPEHRRGAYWSSFCGTTQLFDSPQEAEAECYRSLGLDKFAGRSNADRAQVVPARDQDVPTYWDIERMGR